MTTERPAAHQAGLRSLFEATEPAPIPIRPLLVWAALDAPEVGGLEELLQSGKVRKSQQGLLRLRVARGLMEGTIKKTAGGAGFLIPHKKAATAETGQVEVADLGADPDAALLQRSQARLQDPAAPELASGGALVRARRPRAHARDGIRLPRAVGAGATHDLGQPCDDAPRH